MALPDGDADFVLGVFLAGADFLAGAGAGAGAGVLDGAGVTAGVAFGAGVDFGVAGTEVPFLAGAGFVPMRTA